MSATARRAGLVMAVSLALSIIPTTVSAEHSWGDYHWSRVSNPFTVKLGDAVAAAWSTYLARASNDWSESIVLKTTVIDSSVSPRKCSPTSGQVNVCSERYGFNGWLGVARIWVSSSHIYQGTVKLNDSYFGPSTSPYNTPRWRSLVMCQEIGHEFGLDHQDEDFYNDPLGTCMDYSAEPGPADESPNAHDYDQLEDIYRHLDASSTSPTRPKGQKGGGSGRDQSQWGRRVAVAHGGRTSVHVLALGRDHRIITFVTWAVSR